MKYAWHLYGLLLDRMLNVVVTFYVCAFKLPTQSGNIKLLTAEHLSALVVLELYRKCMMQYYNCWNAAIQIQPYEYSGMLIYGNHLR